MTDQKTGTKLLVVRPRGASAIGVSDELLDALVYKILDRPPPSTLDKALAVAAVVSTYGAIAAAIRERMSTPGRPSTTAIADALPVTRALLRPLLDQMPRVLDAELQVIDEDDVLLNEFKPMGVPRFSTNVTYAMHPLRPNCYLPVADFHRYLLDEKRAEFRRLAAELGAKSIRVDESELRASESSAKLDAAFPSQNGKVDAGAEGGHGKRARSRYGLDAVFGPLAGEPRVLDGACWLHGEPHWQAMVDDRTGRTHLMRQEINFSYSTDFRVNAGLVAKLEGIGLSCGGSFKKMEDVDVTCVVEFHPRASTSG